MDQTLFSHLAKKLEGILFEPGKSNTTALLEFLLCQAYYDKLSEIPMSKPFKHEDEPEPIQSTRQLDQAVEFVKSLPTSILPGICNKSMAHFMMEHIPTVIAQLEDDTSLKLKFHLHSAYVVGIHSSEETSISESEIQLQFSLELPNSNHSLVFTLLLTFAYSPHRANQYLNLEVSFICTDGITDDGDTNQETLQKAAAALGVSSGKQLLLWMESFAHEISKYCPSVHSMEGLKYEMGASDAMWSNEDDWKEEWQKYCDKLFPEVAKNDKSEENEDNEEDEE